MDEEGVPGLEEVEATVESVMEEVEATVERVMEEFNFSPEWGFVEPGPLDTLGWCFSTVDDINILCF
jgi:hypothetical protein